VVTADDAALTAISGLSQAVLIMPLASSATSNAAMRR